MDEIFTLAAQIMTGEDLKKSIKLNDILQSFANEDDIEFTKDLDQCLESTIGREYLYTFLQQTFCDEMVLFLQTIHKFKKQLIPVQRFMIARQIKKISIDPKATFTLNISYECRQNVILSYILFFLSISP